MQETSVEAWKDFKDSPSKANCTRLVAYTLKQNGPLTGREVCEKAGQEGLWKRLSEMEKEGVVKTIGKRICSITGKKALIWTLCEERQEPVVETHNLFEAEKPVAIEITTEHMDRLRSALDRVNSHL
jgi:hypothetical protein